jgi:hypothetical protein
MVELANGACCDAVGDYQSTGVILDAVADANSSKHEVGS